MASTRYFPSPRRAVAAAALAGVARTPHAVRLLPAGDEGQVTPECDAAETVRVLIADRPERIVVDRSVADDFCGKLAERAPALDMREASALGNVLVQMHAFGDLADALAALDKLRATVEWTMRLKLAGNMPTLPSQNSTLRAALMAHKGYMDGLMEVSDVLGAWIEEAQAQGAINPALPAIAVLYTLYARACDPVLGFLKGNGQYTDPEIVDLVMATCFEGLCKR